jgi:hypothetical protein
MAPSGKGSEKDETQSGVFATTHWSVVLAAGQTADAQMSAALEQLCRTYWFPLYAYIRRRGYGHEDAQDLTQGFLFQLLERKSFARVDSRRRCTGCATVTRNCFAMELPRPLPSRPDLKMRCAISAQ